MPASAQFHHERLHVYQRAVEFAAWSQQLVGQADARAAAKEHLRRASVSVPVNIADGNAKSSDRERSQCLQVAVGSALECAACIDVLGAKELLDAELASQGKGRLQHIVSMLYGLMRSQADAVREATAVYGQAAETECPQFDHEKLHVYHRAIAFVRWCHFACAEGRVDGSTAPLLDRSSTGIVLNIAEGNAKFAPRDRGRFLEAATSAAFRSGALLDVLAACTGPGVDIAEGKATLVEVARMLAGLRRHVLEKENGGGRRGGR